MAHNSVDTRRAASQPPIPERFDFEAPWTTRAPGEDNDEVEIQLWADRGRGDGLVRICAGPILGTVADPRQEQATDPDEIAVDLYGRDWVEAQLHTAQELLAFRLGRS
jgi:hypothetical protein